MLGIVLTCLASFLTTNKVGTFDEAFKSRIHMSLYYHELDKTSSKKIWKVNFERIRTTRPKITFDEEDLLKWVKKAWKDNANEGLRPWNGRQIHNACQTAAALAEFQDGGHLTGKHLDAVATASRDFDKYLKGTRGDDAFRAKRQQDRDDGGYSNVELLQPMTPVSQSARSSGIGYAAADSSSTRRSSRKGLETRRTRHTELSSDDSDE